MPRHPDQDDAVPVDKAGSGKTKAVMAVVVVLLVVFIALHLAGVFGP
jgi:hypothetical protein